MLKIFINRFICIFIGLFLVLTLQLNGQILTQEDFVNANGTTSGTMSGGQPWVASVPGGCPGPVSVFSVQTQQFTVTLANGFNCVNCTDGSATPPLNCGDNLNLITFGPIDISNRCNIGITTQITAAGSLECASPGGPPSGPIGGGHDQVACYYSIDGGPDVLYGYMCGNVLVMAANTGNVLSGNSLTIRIYAGNQNPAETYRIDNVVVSYLPKTTPTFTQLGPYCVGDVPDVLPTTSIEGVTGTWNLPAINTGTNGSFVHTFTPDDLVCFNTTTMTVMVNPNTTPNFSAIGPLCEDSNAPILANVSPNGVNGTWDPIVINTGSVGSTDYVFTPDAGFCALPQTLNVTITAQITPNFTAYPAYCAGDFIPALPNTSTNGITGTWSPAINNLATTTYTFTPDVGVCATTTTLAITVNPLVIPDFNQIGPLCRFSAGPTLPTTSLNGVTGFWSPSATVSTTAAGTFTYTFIPSSGPCHSSQTMDIVIHDLPTNITIDFIPDQCINGPVYTLTGSPVGGVWSGTGVSGNSLDPTIPGVGPHTVQYSYTDGNGCTGSATIPYNIINCACTDPITNDAGPDQDICAGETVNVSGVLTNATTFQWSTTGSGTFANPLSLNTIYTPSPADIAAGSIMLNLVADDPDGAGPCSALADFLVVNIAQPPSVTLSGTITICPGECSTGTVNISGGSGLYEAELMIGPPFNFTFTATGLDLNNNFSFCYSGLVPSYNSATQTITIPSFVPPGTINLSVLSLIDLNTLCDGIINSPNNFGITLLADPVVVLTPIGPFCTTDPIANLVANPPGGLWVGPGVVGSTFNPATAGVSNHLILYTYTGANGCSVVETMNVQVNNCAGCVTIATVDAGPDILICPDQMATLSAFVNNGINYQWTTSGTGVFADPFDLTTTYDPSPADVLSGTVILTLTVPDPDGAGPCNAVSDQLEINFNSQPSITLQGNMDVCEGECEQLTYTITGGTGSYNSTLVLRSGAISLITIATLVITSPVTLNICYSGNVLLWDVNTKTLTIPVSQTGLVTLEIQTLTDVGNFCAAIINPPNLYEINLLPAPIVSVTPAGPLCVSDPPITLAGLPSGGSWTGPGVTGNNFDPASVGVGSYVLLYTFTDINGCTGSNTIMIAVNDCGCATPASANAGSDQTICSDDIAALTGIVNFNPSWSTSGSGNFSNPNSLITNYTPSPGDILAGSVTITLTDSDPDGAGPCTAASDQLILNFNSVIVIIDPVLAQCDDDPAFVLNVFPAGGIWTGTGVTGNMFDPALAGSGNHVLTYTVTDGNNCTGFNTITIEVTDCGCPDPADADAGPNLIVCGNQLILLNGSVTTTPLWTTSGTGFFDDPDMNLTIYNPTPADIASGSVTLTLTASDPDGAGPCSAFSDQMIVTFTSILSVTADPVADLCTSGNPVVLTGDPAGGSWTGTGVAGNTFDPGLAGLGSFILTYSVSSGPGCNGSDNITVNVVDPPSVTLNSLPDMCVGDPGIVLSNGTPAGGAYYLNGDFVNPITIFTPNTAGPQTITYIIGPADCSNQAFVSFNVNNCGCASPATADAGIDQSGCDDDIFQLNGAITNAGAATWTGNGDGVFGNLTLLNTTYTPGSNDITNGIVTLTLTTEDPDGAGPCLPANNSMTINIIVTPVIDLQSIPDLCDDDAAVIVTALPAGGILTGPGISGGLFDPAIAGPGTHRIYYQAGITPCTAIDSIDINVLDCDCAITVTIDAGPDTMVCQNSPVQLFGLISGVPGGTWTTNGSGVFSNSTSSNPLYTPSGQDVTTGNVIITYTSDDPDGAGPCNSVTDQKSITFIARPDVILLVTQPSCIDVMGSLKITVLAGQNLQFSVDNGVTYTTDLIIDDLPPGSYQLIVKNENIDCQSTLDFTIATPALPEATWEAISAACSDQDENSFILEATTNMTLPYEVTVNGAVYPDITLLPAVFDQLAFDTYDVIVTDAQGCTLERQFIFTQSSSIELDVTSVYIIDKGESVELTTTITGDYSTITWTPGLYLSCDDCVNPIAKPDSNIIYTVKVSDTQGCSDEATIEVRIRKTLNVFIPNVISPNHDGINDNFTVFTDENVKLVKTLRIFNRWGGVLFERNNFEPNNENLGWNGTFKGQELNPNVYIYLVEVELQDGEIKLFKGDVTLVR